MAQLSSDLRQAIRSARSRPSATALIVGTLAVGLAVNGAIFNFLDALVLRSYEFPNVPKLVRVWEQGRDFNELARDNVAPANFADIARQAQALTDFVAADDWDANIRGAGGSERVPGASVSPDFFAALGVQPVAGRGFVAEEGKEGQNRRVVLGNALWHRMYGGEPMLGRTIVMDNVPYEVVGVAPPGFQFPEAAEFWAPLAMPVEGSAGLPRDKHYLSVFARLAPGRSVSDARADLAVIGRRLAADHPVTNTDRSLNADSFAKAFADPITNRILGVWQAAALLVLLIACVNVANMLMARGAERQRELSVRLALGASRRQIIRQLVTEGALLALAASILSMPLMALGARVMRDNMPAEIVRYIPGWQHLGADWRAFGFSVALAAIATALVSAYPAWRATRAEVTSALRDGGRSVTAGAARQRGRNVLVVAQLSAALALMATAGLSLRGALDLLHGPQGYDTHNLLTFAVSLPENRFEDPQKRRQFKEDTLARLRQLPGVTAATVANVFPARTMNVSRSVEIEGQPLPKNVEGPAVNSRWVEPGYFEVLGLPITSGRPLLDTDLPDGQPVAVISRSMAARFWPGQDAVGKRFRAGAPTGDAPWLTVVGVCGDVIHQWVAQRNSPTWYRSLRQETRLEMVFAARTSGDPEALSREVPRLLAAIDPDVPGDRIQSQERTIKSATIGMQYIAGIMGVFGAIAVVLALTGVYGVLSYRVSLRTLEFGIRMALGASNRDVLRLTLGQASRLAAAGLAVGAFFAFALGRLLASVLQGAIAADAGTLAAATLALGAAAMIAAFIPARRALSLSPSRALRAD